MQQYTVRDVHCDNAMYTYNSDIITHIKGTSETIAHKLQPYDICINGSMMLNNECQRHFIYKRLNAGIARPVTLVRPSET